MATNTDNQTQQSIVDNLPPVVVSDSSSEPPANVSDSSTEPPANVSGSSTEPPANVSDTSYVEAIDTIDEETGEQATHYIRRGGGGGGMDKRPPKRIGEAPRKPQEFFSKVYKLGGLNLTPKHIGVGIVSGIGMFAFAKQIKASPTAIISYIAVAFMSGIALSKIVIKNDRKDT